MIKEVGLGEEDLKYLDTHAYMPNAPVYNDAWAADFLRRTSFSKLILFYFRHPVTALTEMHRDLTHAAPMLRPRDMANYRQKDGYPPRAMATRFSLWSNIRGSLLQVFPYHVLLIYLAPWLAFFLAWKNKRWPPILPVALMLSIAGTAEFTMSALTDALDNSRHLFIFQVITELLILLIAAALLSRIKIKERTPVVRTRESIPLWRKVPARSFSTVRSLLQSSRWELVCFAAFLALVGYQMFLRPVTGLANNSDFMKVLGPWSTCTWDHEAQNNKYLVTDYHVGPDCYYNLGLTSTERLLAGVAIKISRPFSRTEHFDLRVLGASHLVILLIAFAILLRLTRRGPPLVRYGVPALFILIFSDVAYVCYLNSAYMDAASFVLLIGAAAVAAAACFNCQSWLVTVAYLTFGVALVFSKSQHAVLGIFFAAPALVFASRKASRSLRIRWMSVALLLIASTVAMFAITPSSYQIFPIYSLIFSRLGPHSDAPLAMLEEIGLSEADLKYMNTNAYTPGAPIYNALWAENFMSRTSFGDVIAYYLRHPLVPLAEMKRDLQNEAPVLRPTDMPNYRQKDGFPPGVMATRFSLWSKLRSGALHLFPYHVILIYLAPWIAALVAWMRNDDLLRWRVMPPALVLSAAGILEFAMSALTDALDNARHLFLFHVITELLIVMIVAALLDRVSRTRRNVI